MFAKCFSWTHFKKKFSDKILYCDVKQATQVWPSLENTDKIHSNNLALEIQFEMWLGQILLYFQRITAEKLTMQISIRMYIVYAKRK